MTDRKKYVLCAIAVVGTAGIMGASAVSAATSSSSDTSLATKIATAFHLKTADVQKVIDQNHADREAQRAADNKARLDAAVKAGTITQAQEDLIVAKQKELQAAREVAKDSTAYDATRHATMKAQIDALKQWATDNKIPMNLLRPFGGHGPGHGMDGPPPSDSSSTN